jgi:magnesium chelatase family protein
LPSEELLGEDTVHDPANSTAGFARRVQSARRLQLARGGKLNSELDGKEIEAACGLDRHCRRLLAQARLKLDLSARGIHRVLRIARTISDLALGDKLYQTGAAETKTGPGNDSIGPVHLAEALQLRRALE